MKYFQVYINKDSDQVKIIIDNETITYPFDELSSVSIEGCPNNISIVYKFENSTRELMSYKVIEEKLENSTQ